MHPSSNYRSSFVIRTELEKILYPQNEFEFDFDFDFDYPFFRLPTDSSHIRNHMEFGNLQHQFLGIYTNHTPTGDSLEEPTQNRNGEGRKQQSRRFADKHSKINTARGPRDRRIRLSLDVARRFFDLQDLLGFDKASRTLDWLLKSSRIAIKELASKLKNPHKEEEKVSVSDKPASVEHGVGKMSKRKKPSGSAASSRRGVRVVGMESRRMARERARERTSQKKRRLFTQTYNLPSSNAHVEAASSSSYYDIGFAFEDPPGLGPLLSDCLHQDLVYSSSCW